MTGRRGRLVRVKPNAELTHYVERGQAEQERGELCHPLAHGFAGRQKKQ